MATTFLEPGGDATFNAATTAAGGIWSGSTGVTVVTDFVHGNHINSLKYRASFTDTVFASTVLSDSGSRVSIYLYFVALPSSNARVIDLAQSDGTLIVSLQLTSAGILQLWATGAQIGTNGSTISTGVWYRISLAYTISSTSVNRFELFKNGVSDISITNGALNGTTTSRISIGNILTNSTLDFRSSDHYIDNSSSLTDTGDVWVTAKRPFSNGTINGFTTQIGSGNSGYGTGHADEVNERPTSTSNGWSMVGAGAAVTEEYNIESNGSGDIIIGNRTIDYIGWVNTKALVGETINIIMNGVNFAQAITSTATVYTKVAGSTTYPLGAGTDIGIQTDTSLTTVSLYDCGIMVAFFPADNVFGNYSPNLEVGSGLSRNERAT